MGVLVSVSQGFNQMPEHEPGDLLLGLAFGITATAPEAAAGSGSVPPWQQVLRTAPQKNGTCYSSWCVAKAIATADNHTAGAWQNAAIGAVVVLREVDEQPIGGTGVSTASGGNYPNAPAVPLESGDDSTIQIYGLGYSSAGQSSMYSATWDPANAAYTNLATSAGLWGRRVLVRYNTTQATGASNKISVNAVTTQGVTIEVVSNRDVKVSAAGQFFHFIV
jgi:hypothetical protein